MSAELLRIVDVLSRDKNIDRDTVFVDLEMAMVSAVRKAYDQEDEVVVTIDRTSGVISATRFGTPIEMRELGRIAAQTAKQVMIQRIREAERGSILEEFSAKQGQVITGTATRFENGAIIVNIGRTEGILPRSEQIPGEMHHPGERIRALIMEVREAPNQVRIILSRSHPDLIRRLFEAEVPEVAERIIEIRALAREAGYRTKVAVTSIDSRVDAVGACVGVRGSRIKAIVDELGGEKIDIVRWNESSQILVTNALRPAEITEIALCFELGRVTVVVNEDQLSLAIGKRGQNVRLAARLTGWDIDILTPAEYNKGLDDLEKTLLGVEGVDAVFVNKLVAMGIISVMDVEEVGADPLVKELEAEQTLAEQIVSVASEAAKTISVEIEAEKARRAAERAAEKAAAEKAATEGAASEEAGTETGEATSDEATSDEATSDKTASDEATSVEAGTETGEATSEEAVSDEAGSETSEAASGEEDSSDTNSDEADAGDESSSEEAEPKDESGTEEGSGEESEPVDLIASSSDETAGEDQERAGQEAPVPATEAVEPSVELNKSGE